MRGEATILAEPELATVSVTVEAQGGDQGATLELLSRRSKAVADLVASVGSGVERVETSRLHVYAELDQKRTEKVRRYVGRTTTTLVVNDFTVLSDLIAGAGSIDLASVAGPFWRLRENSPVYREARLAAAVDALTRARDYAAAFGAELVGLVEIADVGMSQPQHGWEAQAQPRFLAARGMAADDGPAFDLQPASQQVVGQVEARFTLTQPDLAHAVPADRAAT